MDSAPGKQRWTLVAMLTIVPICSIATLAYVREGDPATAATWGVATGIVLAAYIPRILAAEYAVGLQARKVTPTIIAAITYLKRRLLQVAWRVRVYLALLSVAAISITIGYVNYGSEFSSNLLGEGAGIIISVVIGFTLVERLIEMESRRKWERVREYTEGSIKSRLHEIDTIIRYAPHLEIPSEIRSPPTLASTFKGYADHIRQTAELLGNAEYLDEVIVDPTSSRFANLPEGMTSYHSEPKEDGTRIIHASSEEVANRLYQKWLDEISTKQFYEQLLPHLGHLRRQLLPRIIEFGYEPELIEALVAVEAAEEHWASAIQLIEDDWGLPEKYAWAAMADVLDECAELAEKIDEQPAHRQRIVGA